MVSFRSFYHPIDAAILWSNLADHETEILQVELSDPGGLLKHFPQWPTLHLYAKCICDAIIYGELQATYLGGPIGLSCRRPKPTMVNCSRSHPQNYQAATTCRLGSLQL